MKEEEKKSGEINFLALQVLYCMELIGYSPSNQNANMYTLKHCDGTTISLRSAFAKVKKDVNYLDDELLEKINSYPYIRNKLKKDCNNK